MHTGKRRWQLVLHTFVILTQIAALSGLGYFAASLGNTSVAYAAAAGPGGVTANLALWLRADVGTSTTTNGAAVTTWADQSGLANNATVAGTQANNPTYTTVASNFNPGVLFNGSATKRFNTAAQVISLGNTSYAAFGFADGGGPTVFSEGPQTTNNGIYLRNGVTGGPFPPEPTHDFVNNSYAPAQTVANAPRLLDWRYISASSTRTIGVNGGAELTNSTQTLNMGASVGYIGQDLNAGAIYYAGNIDEVIVYNGNSLTATQIQQIHSYLSLKYGLTLATAQNYLASDGTTITWNATTNAAYNNNITGIARDDASAFNQKQSKNLNAAALVTMSLGTLAASNAANTSTFPTDKSYDVYGDNAGATTLTGSYGGTANNRLARVWKVQETGTVGAVQVYLPTSTNAGLKQIIVSHTDPTFGTVDVQAPLTTSGANYVASVDLANGDYFTFASDTTPPDTTIVTTPANPTNSTSGTFTFTGSDNVTAPASLTFQCSLDGGAYAACTSPKTYTGLAAGNHTFTVRAIDAAGNIDPTPATYTWTIDLTAPVVNLNAAGPINNTNKSAYPVSGTCDPAEGVVTVQVGTVTTTTPCTAGGTFSTTVDASAVPDGASTTITASQTDAAGNTGAAIKTVLKDTVAPVVTVAAPTPINSTNKSAYPVSGTCNTADGNVTVNVGGITKTTACTAGAFSTTVDASTLADGASVPITASQTDTAGNTGTGTNTTSKDTVPPTVGANPLTPINNTNKGAYPVSGTCDPAAGTVTVKVGTATTTTPCTAGGTFSTTIDASAVPDGPAVPVTVSQTDPAGNIGSTSGTVLKDTAAPTATPVITSPASGATTNNTKPTFTGNGAEPGSTVTVKDGTTVVCTAVADSSGNWGCPATTPLSEGPHSITATSTDPAGNVGPSSPAQPLTIDTTAPVAPVVSSPAAGASTNNNKPPITGTAEPGSTVTVKDGATTLCTAVADASGNWTCTPTTALSDGPHSITATATDAAGNVGPASTPTTFTVDTVAPVAPIISSPAAGGTTNQTSPTIAGTAEPGSTVTVTEGGTTICTAVADASGNWTCTPTTPLSNSPHTLSATATDPAGNTSPAGTDTFTVNTSAVSTPSILTPAAGSSTNVTTPTFTGKADPGTTVKLTEGGTTICTAVADASGNWSCTATTALPEGSHTVTAVATNPSGTSSTPGTRTFAVDTTAPTTAPTITSPAKGATTGDNTPDVTGTGAEPGSTVTVKDGPTTICTTIADASGNWTCTPTTPLTDGPHNITATTTDPAGNTGPTSPVTPVTIDTTAPTAPKITSPAAGGVTNATTPVIAGTAEPGSTVTVTEGGTTLCTTVADASGSWTCTPTTPLSNGPHTIAATATDPAGNTSPAGTDTFTVDPTAVSTPSIDKPAPGSSTNDTTPTFSGHADPGTTVTLKDGPTTICTTTVDASGNWSCTPTTPLSEGPHTITATATDTGGKSSTPATVPITVDTVLPAAPVVNPIIPGRACCILPITGKSEPGSTVTVTDGPTTICTAVTDASGNWTCTPTTALTEGTTVTATATDPAGNVSPPTTTKVTTGTGTDTDGDGVPDAQEVLDGTDPNDPKSFKDSDGDRVPDYVETQDGTNPNDPKSFKDTDGGGVPDYVETVLYPNEGLPATDINNRADDARDTDGDGVSDYQELKDGTNPKDRTNFKRGYYAPMVMVNRV